jgi:hypothetical protein
MNHALYAHMNNKRKKKKGVRIQGCLEEGSGLPRPDAVMECGPCLDKRQPQILIFT